MPQPNALRLVVLITLSSSLLGALFAYAENRPHGIADFVNTELRGVLAGGLNGGILSSLEIFVLRGAYGASLRQLPFLPYLALRSLLYLGVILLVLIASNLRVGVTRANIAFSLAMSLGFNLLLGVNDLLGPGVLFAFVAGRYDHPRREERILLFIDMRASTAIAERLGEERFLDFLNRFITDLSLAIADAGGEIHKYVGQPLARKRCDRRHANHQGQRQSVQALILARSAIIQRALGCPATWSLTYQRSPELSAMLKPSPGDDR